MRAAGVCDTGHSPTAWAIAMSRAAIWARGPRMEKHIGRRARALRRMRRRSGAHSWPCARGSSRGCAIGHVRGHALIPARGQRAPPSRPRCTCGPCWGPDQPGFVIPRKDSHTHSSSRASLSRTAPPVPRHRRPAAPMMAHGRSCSCSPCPGYCAPCEWHWLGVLLGLRPYAFKEPASHVPERTARHEPRTYRVDGASCCTIECRILAFGNVGSFPNRIHPRLPTRKEKIAQAYVQKQQHSEEGHYTGNN